MPRPRSFRLPSYSADYHPIDDNKSATSIDEIRQDPSHETSNHGVGSPPSVTPTSFYGSESPLRTFIPFDGPDPPKGHPPLDYKPFVLRRWFLLLTTAFRIHKGYYRVTMIYTPAIVGSITSMWWKAVHDAYKRITPYIAMSETPPQRQSKAFKQHFKFIYAVQNPFDIMTPFMQSHHLTGIITVINLTVNFTIVSLKNAFYVLNKDGSGWFISLSNTAGHLLAIMYGTLVACSIGITYRLWPAYTGLKWDPAPVAVQLSMVQGSNIFPVFKGLEYSYHPKFIKQIASESKKAGILRLGYWSSATNSHDIIYSLRFMKSERENNFISEDVPDTQIDTLHEQRDCSHHMRRGCSPELYNLSGMPSSFKSMCKRSRTDSSLEAPYGPESDIVCSPQFSMFISSNLSLSDSGILIFIILGIVSSGLWIGIATRAGHANTITVKVPYNWWFSNWENLFYFLPTISLSVWNLAWLRAAYFYRHVQPIACMDGSKPPQETVLLDYLSISLSEAIYTAITNRHFRVAISSLLAMVGTIIQILPGKVFFNVSWRGHRDKVEYIASIVPSYLYGCLAITIVYIILLGFLRPTPQYRTPRACYNIVDLVSYCYNSKMLDDPEFDTQDPTDEEIHFKSKIHLAKRKYQIGMYLGKDGHRHLGFDIVPQKTDDPTHRVKVDKFYPGKAIYWIGVYRKFIESPKLRPTNPSEEEDRISSEQISQEDGTELQNWPTHSVPEVSAPESQHQAEYNETPTAALHEQDVSPLYQSHTLPAPDPENRSGLA
ncbi:uncharacterized protein K452DRAFT_354802 [Aplosporella prunicola CBS 121167]|uniref:Uncharacterized protein n=1 Tax=Aplosporella prunicola CBS 121167 TaxID=1176127 RepID=A0A6A6BX29_9PEZI|nr:uncharacterized protein K452DRAFT_354802 [Aplosporella prunicola CBS 121167]KAF2147404.1 hypothetical protein K452DRAFT_354802 [Aplosporella prunicola CBS 121167]